MAGLEVLYNYVINDIATPQDALVCFVHWELVKAGYKCLGNGEKPGIKDKRSELLPVNWNKGKNTYTLRYQSHKCKNILLMRAIMEEDRLINLAALRQKEVPDLTLELLEFVNPNHLHNFNKVYKNIEELRKIIKSAIIFTSFKKAEQDEIEEENINPERIKSAIMSYFSKDLLVPAVSPESLTTVGKLDASFEGPNSS
ncbi:PSMF1 inhibitor, partial [Polypterus senegalus]